MTNVQFEERVRQSLDRSVATFNAGMPEFVDELTDDAMIVTTEANQPLKGREAYQQRFAAASVVTAREKMVLSRNVQIVDNKAVVTQTARVREGHTTSDVLQTIVFGQSGDDVKVLHLHNALLAPKRPHEDYARPPVQVVNERIATIASVSGVAQ